MSTFYIKRNDNDLMHYGVLGMKWGIRRYQNPDGSLTKEGREKYLKAVKSETNNLTILRNSYARKSFVDTYNKTSNVMNSGGIKAYNEAWDERKKDVPEKQRYNNQAYVDAYQEIFNKVYETILNKKFTSLYTSRVKEVDDLIKGNKDKEMSELIKPAEEILKDIMEANEDNISKMFTKDELNKLWDKYEKSN